MTRVASWQDSSGDWAWMVNDGLDSVRGALDEGFDPLYYEPYGDPWGAQGSEQTDFGFTGEPSRNSAV